MELNLENFSVPMQAQGHEATIAVATYPEETIRYWLEYGVRRAYQDGINSAAKIARDAGTEVDAPGLFAARDDMFRKAAMGQRKAGSGGDGLTELQRMIVTVADEHVKTKEWKAKIEGWADMSTPERRAAKYDLLTRHEKFEVLTRLAKDRLAEPEIKLGL